MSWTVARLGDICTFENGDRGKNYPSKSAILNSGVPFVNAGDLVDGTLPQSNLDYISESHFSRLSNGKFKKGDFLFCLRGTLGKFALVTDELCGAIASSLIIVRPGKALHAPYLKAYLASELCRNEIELHKNGAAQPNLAASSLKQFRIPLPPLDEQKRIAAILDQAGELRRMRQRAIDRLNQLGQAVFYEMFGDPTAPDANTAVRLADVAELINGDRSSNYPSGNDIKDSGILFLNTTNIKNGELDLSKSQFITEKKFASLSRGKLARGDLVITLRGTLGQCALFDCEFDTGFINAQMMIIRCSDRILPRYLKEFISFPSVQKKLNNANTGSAVPQLTATQMKEMQIIVPSLEEQQIFVSSIESARAALGSQSAHFDSLNKLFSALQHCAFRGDL